MFLRWPVFVMLAAAVTSLGVALFPRGAPAVALAPATPATFAVRDLTAALDSRYVYGATLSPDGARLAWSDEERGLCTYMVATEIIRCHPWPDDFKGSSYIDLIWSPGSDRMAFTDQLGTFEDTDIWLFEVVTERFVNRTDDPQAERSAAQSPLPFVMRDHSPLWSAGGDPLYFFRTFRQGPARTLPYERVSLHRATDGAPMLVRALNDILSPTTDIIDAAVSPDGAQIALVKWNSRPQTDDEGVWLLDVERGLLAQAARPAALRVGLPRDYYAAWLAPHAVRWAPDGNSLIVHLSDGSYYPPLIPQSVVRYDLDTHLATPLLDFTDLPNDSSIFEVGSDRVPRSGMMTADGAWYFFLTMYQGEGKLWALPLAGGAPALVAAGVEAWCQQTHLLVTVNGVRRYYIPLAVCGGE